MERWDRRDVLRATGLLGGSTLLAGCFDGALSGVLRRSYTRWVPAPRALATVERFDLVGMTPTVLADTAVVPRDVRGRFAVHAPAAIDLLDVSFAGLTGLYRIGQFAVVCEGSFDTVTVGDRLRSEGYRPVGTYDGFDQFASTSAGQLVAAASDAVVFGPWAGGTGHIVEAVIDARNGDRQRYRAVDRSFGELTEVLGNGDLVVGRTGGGMPIDDIVATGMAWRIDEQTAKATLGLVFPPDSSVDTDAIQRLTAGGNMAAYEDVEVGQRGRVGVVTATLPEVSSDALSPVPTIGETMGVAPTVTFDVSYGTDDRTATIVHRGGDPIPRSRLALRGEGFRQDPSLERDAPGRWAGQTSEGAGVVGPGDRLTVAISPGAELRLTYRPIGRRQPVTLATIAPTGSP